MKDITSISTLKVKVCASIESPPGNNRETFKQSVISTVLHILRSEDVSIEYIGYNPDHTGLHILDNAKAEFEDCVFISLNVRGAGLNPLDNEYSNQDLLRTFVNVFEKTTHRHLEIDATIVRKGERQRMIEMHSDWKLLRNHG